MWITVCHLSIDGIWLRGLADSQSAAQKMDRQSTCANAPVERDEVKQD